MRYLIFILLTIPLILRGQNIVPNSGFEQKKNCLFCGDLPTYSDKQLENAKKWENFNTSDWFTIKNFSNANHGTFLTPQNIMQPHSGNFYAGFGPCEGGQIKLDNKIPKRSLVQFSLWWSPKYNKDTEMNLFILKNQSGGITNCYNPNIDKKIHSNFLINAGGNDAIHKGGNWYYYQSDYIYSNEDEYEWFAFKGRDIIGDGGSDEYLYVDDVTVTTRDFCDHPCAPESQQIFLNAGSNNVVIPSAMAINLNPWHVYVQNAMYINFTVFDRWGGVIYEREDYDPNLLKDNGFNDYLFAWNGLNKNGIPLQFGLYTYRFKAENCTPAYKYEIVNSVFVFPTGFGTPIQIPTNIPTTFNANCCLACRTLNSNTYGSKIFKTSNCIVAQSNFNITSGQDIIFDAGENVLLKPGVKVTSGGRLLCKTGGCFSNGSRFTDSIQSYSENAMLRPIEKLMKENDFENFHIGGDNILVENQIIAGVYPNPVKDYANLYYKVKSEQRVKISIYNSIGFKLKQLDFTESIKNFHLDFSDYSPGIYFIKFIAVDGEQTVKMIKQ